MCCNSCAICERRRSLEVCSTNCSLGLRFPPRQSTADSQASRRGMYSTKSATFHPPKASLFHPPSRKLDASPSPLWSKF